MEPKNFDLAKGPRAGSSTDDEVVRELLEKFEANKLQVYTQIGARMLVHINPNEELMCYGDNIARLYVEDFKKVDKNAKEMEPHIFKVAESAYLHMKQTELNQSLIFLGESGGGKTSQRKLALAMLSLLKEKRKPQDVFRLVRASNVVIEAFTNAHTSHVNASRAGIYQEVQFDDNAEAIGCKTISYHLELSRVTHPGNSERNFHVFHYLANGSGKMREELGIGIGGGISFEYLKKAEVDTNLIHTDDGIGFEQLTQAMKAMKINTKSIKSIFKVLAGILALGNLTFRKDSNSYRQELIVNGIESVVDSLGVEKKTLEEAITNKSQLIGRQRVEVVLDIEGANERKHELARTLYKQLVNWIIDTINQQLCRDEAEVNTFIGLVDMPGYAAGKKIGFYQMCFNYLAERMHHFMNYQVFTLGNEEYAAEKLKSVPVVKHKDRSKCLDLFMKAPDGLFAVLDQQYNAYKTGVNKEKRFDTGLKGKDASMQALRMFSKAEASNPFYVNVDSKNDLNVFGVQHFFGSTTYMVDKFTPLNMESSVDDFTTIFVGDRYSNGSKNTFIAGLFSNTEDTTKYAPTKTKKQKAKATPTKSGECVVTKFQRDITDLVTTLDDTLPWFVLCMKSNSSFRPRVAESKIIRAQVKAYSLGDVVRRKRVEFAAAMKHEDFCFRYDELISSLLLTDSSINAKEKCKKLKSNMKLSSADMSIGETKVFVSYSCWRKLDDPLRRTEIESSPTVFKKSLEDLELNEKDSFEDSELISEKNEADSDKLGGGESKNKKGKKTQEKDIDDTKVKKDQMSSTRRNWLRATTFFTWWIPDPMIKKFAKLERSDQVTAWREKFALCSIIFYLCALVLFWIGGLGVIICPKQNIYSAQELAGHSTAKDALVSVRGEVFNVKDFNHAGINFKYIADRNYLGKDLSYLFPFQLSFVCLGLDIDPRLSLQDKPSLYSDVYYHDHRWYRHPDDDQAFNYYQYHVMRVLRKSRRAGNIAIDPKYILKDSPTDTASNTDVIKYRSIINGEVFDLTNYINSGGAPFLITPDGISNDTTTVSNREFLDNDIKVLFESNPGKDVTEQWKKYAELKPKIAQLSYNCLRGAFYMGVVDIRKSVRCYVANYMLLSGSVFIVSIIFFKFIASIRFGSNREPEPSNIFVVCNIPCYTEGEESLRGTIDSLAKLKYDDKRKLLFIVCDGMIMGAGNDRPTPRIVLDILGVNSNEDSEALSYIALGDGMKQHNMAKVYSGLYEIAGRVVPYLVIAKCGTPLERSKPGNRGKRDSQILLMRFFNKVHFNSPMTPLELEMFHQIKNVIGVNPGYYELVFMVDADTIVYEDSLNRLVSALQHDSKTMGICGETRLANAKSSWTTMMQVYEYFIAHHLSKAFESLFGTVTCLPGCFTMYRMRGVDKAPLLIANNIIEEYSTNKADTLHKKNLLYLGEDRYLTTLMLKNFSYYKTRFIADAKCETNAPDSWSILVSQRRRWINSTVHNLFELAFLSNMCGFCCFSMRFVVFIDLISTLVMPATLGYLAILAYQLTSADANTSYVSVYLLVGIYAMQALVFIFHRQWQHIGWMIIYLLAIPLFSCIIPVYSFWHFDDFSWGNTRIVVGESGAKILVNADEADLFDPATIPMRKWSDYEKELVWDMSSNKDKEENGSQLGSVVPRSGSAIGNIPRAMSRLMTSGPGSATASVYIPEGGGYGYGYQNNGVSKFTINPHHNGYSEAWDENQRASMMYNNNFVDPNYRNSFNPDMVRAGVPMRQNPSFASSGMVPDHMSQNMANRMSVPVNAAEFGVPSPLQHQSMVINNTYGGMIPNNSMNMNMNTNMNMNMNMANPGVGMVSPYSSIPNMSAPAYSENQFAPNMVNAAAMNQVVMDQQENTTNNVAPAPQAWESGIPDEAIRSAVSRILGGCDLMTVSKKDVRNQVAGALGIGPAELKLRRDVINTIILEELQKLH